MPNVFSKHISAFLRRISFQTCFECFACIRHRVLCTSAPFAPKCLIHVESGEWIHQCMSTNERNCSFYVCIWTAIIMHSRPLCVIQSFSPAHMLVFQLEQRTDGWTVCIESHCSSGLDWIRNGNNAERNNILVDCIVGGRIFVLHLDSHSHSHTQAHTFTSTHPCGYDYTKSV